MKKFKTIFAFLLSAALFIVNCAAYEPVAVRVNGSESGLDARLIDSTTYVGLDEAGRMLSEAAGVSIGIDAAEGDCYITARGRYIGGSDCLSIDGAIYVPIRSLAKVYNASVEWRDETRSVDILISANDGIEYGGGYYIADEVYWLSRIISAEAQGEPMPGKILVGNVVLNRMFSDEFPNTIYDVIFDRKYGVQFTPIVNGMIYREPTEESVIAAKICLDAYYISRDALYFLNPSIATNFWIPANRPYITSVGCHDFYS